MFGVFEIGVETEDGGVGAELSEAAEEECGIDHNASESNFFLREAIGEDEESGEESDEDSDIIGESAFDALTCDDAHDVDRDRIKCKSTNKIWNEEIFLK